MQNSKTEEYVVHATFAASAGKLRVRSSGKRRVRVRSSRLDSRVRLLVNRRLDLLELRPVASSCGCGNARVVEVQEIAQRVDCVADVSTVCTAGR